MPEIKMVYLRASDKPGIPAEQVIVFEGGALIVRPLSLKQLNTLAGDAAQYLRAAIYDLLEKETGPYE